MSGAAWRPPGLALAAFVLLHLAAVSVLALGAYGLGAVFCGRLRFSSRLERAAMTTAFGLGVFGTLLFGLGLLGLLTRAAVLVLLGLGPLSAALRGGPRSRPADVRPSPARPSPRRIAAGVVAALALALLLPALARSLYPPTGWDATMYHLPVARAYAEVHRVQPLPNLRYPVFPQLQEMLFTAALLTADDVTAQLVAWLFFLLIGAGVASWGARLAGPVAGVWALVLWAGSPLVLDLASAAYVEMGLAAFALFAFGAFERARETGDPGWAAVSGAFAGFAAASKYSGLFVVAVLGAGWLAAGIRDRSRRRAAHQEPRRRAAHQESRRGDAAHQESRRGDAARNESRRRAAHQESRRGDAAHQESRRGDAARFASAAAMCGGAWYVWIAMAAGDPLWPFLGRWLGVRFWSAGDVASCVATLRAYGWGHGWVDLLRLPWNLAFRQPAAHHGILPLLFILLPLTAWAALRRADVRRPFALACAFTLLWFAATQQLRFLVPILPVLAVLTAAAAFTTLRGFLVAASPARVALSPAARWALTGLLGAAIAARAAAHLLGVFEEGPPPATPAAREAYVARALPAVPLYRALDRALGRGYKVYAYRDEALTYYCEGTHLGDWFGPARYADLPLDSGERLAAHLARLGATHLLLRAGMAPPALLGDPGFAARFALVARGAAGAVYRRRD